MRWVVYYEILLMNLIQRITGRIRSFSVDVKSFLFENRTTGQTVAKNTVWLSMSNFGGRLLKAVVIIYAARVLDPAGWGIFSYAVTLAGFFTLFVDPGINVMLMREGSKTDEEGKTKVLSTTFYMKVVLIAPWCCSSFLLARRSPPFPGQWSCCR